MLDEALGEESSSHFEQQFNKWRELNLTGHFLAFVRELGTMADSLPLRGSPLQTCSVGFPEACLVPALLPMLMLSPGLPSVPQCFTTRKRLSPSLSTTWRSPRARPSVPYARASRPWRETLARRCVPPLGRRFPHPPSLDLTSAILRSYPRLGFDASGI